ncbi:MAG: YIP1 family protein [Alphaproteobacteria bacterium]|nr:YIP1 family protein [Alphaproteobacteria bacterium]MBV9371970.1 YIP1 family protein [Alphaproteobacteria bacterium]MBV9902645.1 YIP1 family protein [Alphaproteobacteria bacterium]
MASDPTGSEPTPPPVSPAATPPPAYGGAHASLVERAKNILLQPNAEWDRIDAEPDTIAGIYQRYVFILAAIGPVAKLIGSLVFGYRFLGIVYRPSPVAAIAQAVVEYATALGGVYVMAMIIEALAPNFGGIKNRTQGFKVAAYSSTAAWLAGIFWILPPLGMLSIVGLYSLYLFWVGLPKLMKVPADKAVGYTLIVIVAAIVVFMVIGYIGAAVASGFAGPVPSGSLSLG